MPTPLNEKFLLLQQEVAKEVLERQDPIYTGLLALISGKHHFQLGAPGVAKSALVERFVARIGDLPQGGYFHYLLDKFTKPEELFGAWDMKMLMEDHRLVRVSDWALPAAFIAFIDEIFKGNSSVLNSLLLAMNERLVNTDRGPVPINLISLFSASNELPESKELNAMWDRLHIRHWVEPLTSGGSFSEMLTAEWDDDPPPVITLGDIQEAMLQARQVTVGQNIKDGLYELRLRMSQEGLEPSDRRWKHGLDVIKAAAWLEGASSVDIRHARVLRDILWDDDVNRRKVQTMCVKLADPLEAEVFELWDEVGEWQDQWRKTVATVQSEDDRQGVAVELWGKTEKQKARITAIQKKAKKEGRSIDSADALIGNIDKLITELLLEGFELDAAELLLAGE